MKNWLSTFVYQVQRGDIVLAVVVVLLFCCTFYWAVRFAGLLRGNPRLERTAKLSWQIGLVLGLEQAYEFIRGSISHRADVAFPNAYRVLDLEWRHGLFIEQRIEHFFLHFRMAMNVIDLFYVVAHVTVTIGVLVYLYLRRQEHFWFARNLIMLTTAFALVAFYVYPTAPPRMFYNYGFVDPAQLHHFVSWGGAQPDSYTYNPYAAMPSVHVAYALVASWGLVLAERRWFIRIIAAGYPVIMTAAVIISGNHWVLDVMGALVTVALAGAVLGAAGRLQNLLRRWVPDHDFAAVATYESK